MSTRTFQQPERPVYVGRFDVATAYGWGMAALWQGLLSNQTAIASTDRFAHAQFSVDLAATVPDLKVAKDSSRAWAILERLLAPLAGTLAPDTPLILATTVGEIEYIEQAAAAAQAAKDGHSDDDVAPKAALLASKANPNVLLGKVKKYLGLTGRAMVMSSACASSTAAISMAATIVKQKGAKQVLVVAVDALSEFVYSGFSALSSLSETPASPFDANRTGLTLGEAGAWMLVTSQAAAAHRSKPDNEPIELAGWASSADASHMTAPDATGSGLVAAVQRACTMANCEAQQAAFVAAHGTATLYSDAMEMAAFASLMPEPRPVFSIKGGIGHTLGAAGIVQLLVAHQAMQQRVVPPTVGLVNVDDDAQNRATHSPSELPADISKPLIALTTNSGFGGVNSAIVLKQGGPL